MRPPALGGQERPPLSGRMNFGGPGTGARARGHPRRPRAGAQGPAAADMGGRGRRGPGRRSRSGTCHPLESRGSRSHHAERGLG